MQPARDVARRISLYLSGICTMILCRDVHGLWNYGWYGLGEVQKDTFPELFSSDLSEDIC